MQKDPTCFDGGLLTSTRYPIPDDKRIFYEDEDHPVACNQLYCMRCKSLVRHFDGYQIEREPHPDEHLRLGETTDPDTFPLLYKSPIPTKRFYFCWCFTYDTNGMIPAPSLDDCPWACGGHKS